MKIKPLVISILCIIITVVLIGTFINTDKSHKKTEEKNDVKEKVETVKIINDELSFFPLEEGFTYNIKSEYPDFGEKIKVLAKQDNAYLVSGEYANSLQFYRLYMDDQEGINIYYEVTNNERAYTDVEKMLKEKDFDSIFSLQSNQEFFILKKPYVVGNNWGYGKITSVKDVDDLEKAEVTVEFENGNKMIYSKKFGLQEIDYTVPKELTDIYHLKLIKATLNEG